MFAHYFNYIVFYITLYKKASISLLAFLLCSSLFAQDTSLFQRKFYIKNNDTLPYRLLLPQDYDSTKQYPLVFFLHGRGESGTDNNKQLTHGAKLFVDAVNRSRFPAIVVFPQCPATSYWSNVHITTDSTGKRHFHFQKGGAPTLAMRLANELLHYVLETYPIKEDQVYAGGLSMGGMGTFEIVRRNPKLFAAAIAICGGAHPATAKKLKRTHWWIFHGGKDDIVDPAFSETMVKALKGKGADVQFTLYPQANHNSWDSAFTEPNLLPWLFSRYKK